MTTVHQSLEGLLEIPMRHRQFSAPLGKLHYVIAGNPNGRPVVFFHGANMGIGQWFPNLRHLATRYKLIALDMYNAGESATLPLNEQRVEHYEEAARLFFHECIGGDAAIVAHSFGAWLAIRIAESYPKEVRALALAGPVGLAPRIPLRQRALQVPILRELILRTALSPTTKHIESFARSGFSATYHLSSAFTKYLLSHTLTAPTERNPYRFVAMMVSAMSALRGEDKLKNSRIPVLIMAGEQEEMLAIDSLGGLAQAREDISLVTILDARHVPNLEQPATFNEHLDTFLKNYFRP